LDVQAQTTLTCYDDKKHTHGTKTKIPSGI